MHIVAGMDTVVSCIDMHHSSLIQLGSRMRHEFGLGVSGQWLLQHGSRAMGRCVHQCCASSYTCGKTDGFICAPAASLSHLTAFECLSLSLSHRILYHRHGIFEEFYGLSSVRRNGVTGTR